MKDFFRKRLVALKRSPQTIPLIALLIAFVYYSLNLSKISSTTAYINGPNLGLSEFAVMLFSLLSFVCFLNSFPKRKKPRFAMIGLMYVLFGIMIAADFNYRSVVAKAIQEEGMAENLEKNPYVMEAYNMVNVHVILLIVVAVLIALIPVYGKLLKKINTNIELEYSNNVGTIDVDEE